MANHIIHHTASNHIQLLHPSKPYHKAQFSPRHLSLPYLKTHTTTLMKQRVFLYTYTHTLMKQCLLCVIPTAHSPIHPLGTTYHLHSNCSHPTISCTRLTANTAISTYLQCLDKISNLLIHLVDPHNTTTHCFPYFLHNPNSSSPITTRPPPPSPTFGLSKFPGPHGALGSL